MLEAELHGKVPSELTWREDILTSTVFGLLKYLSTPEIILNILRNCFNVNNDSFIIPDDIKRISYHFWLRLKKSEPDLILVLHSTSGEHLIGIEVKYISEKSSTEDYETDSQDRSSRQRDQLAREIEDLYDPVNYLKLEINSSRILSISMVYLTLESFIPREELIESIKSIEQNGICSFKRHQLYWLSWKLIYAQLKGSQLSPIDDLILFDLRRYLERKNLISFSEFNLLKVSTIEWSYSNYGWKQVYKVLPLSWKYKGIQKRQEESI